MARFGSARRYLAQPDAYAHWDAAYVLGALSLLHRREFEAHLRSCVSCQRGVGELSGMPALLSGLTLEDVITLETRETD